jgi:3-dehydroquinate dehydratase/shikimate dehydrogenase
MNNRKICVSVCAETADEFIKNIKRAAEFADVIELRFDCLESKQIHKTFALLSSNRPLLLTYRPKEQGGKTDADHAERLAFWNAFVLNGSLDLRKFWIDCEFDLKSQISNLSFRKIISFHDFSNVPQNLNQIYEDMSVDLDVIKIAVQAGDAADSIAVWKLLEKAKSENKRIIPIAMGASGVWTRILGLAHGAFMTYAALDSGKETADGQITAKDLIETYRVKELDENTEIYGIIGNPIAHSVSPFMHNAAFKFHDLDAVYIPFEVKNLDEFIKTFLKEVHLNFKGFSVTIPHKQAIIEYLDEIAETAKTIGAVNTVKIENGKLLGYNTDAEGFIEPLKTAYGDLKNAKVAVIGAGGAARALVYALKNENAEATLFARNLAKAKSFTEDFQIELKELPKTEDQRPKTDFANFDIVVNATPLGTKGALENETVLSAEQLEGVKLVYDLVYNPLETRLMSEAKKASVPAIGGLEMLIAQAAAQQKIWTGKIAPIEKMRQAALLKLE